MGSSCWGCSLQCLLTAADLGMRSDAYEPGRRGVEDCRVVKIALLDGLGHIYGVVSRSSEVFRVDLIAPFSFISPHTDGRVRRAR